MRLFCNNDKPLKFDLVGLSKKTFAKMEKIILANGGEIEHNDKQPIKFTKESKYVTHAFPAYKLYSINFILVCVKRGAIVDSSSYRIGTPMMCDKFVMHHFLHGECDHCVQELPIDIVKMEPQDYPDNEEHFSETENNENYAIKPEPSEERVLSHSQEANVLPPDSCENSDLNNEEPEDRGNGLNLQCTSSPLLQPKKNNISLLNQSNVTTSNVDALSSQVVAGVSSRKRPLGNSNFIADSDEEENIIPENQQNQIDNPRENSSTADDTADEVPEKRAAYSDSHQYTPSLVKSEPGKKRGRGPRITPIEDREIVKFLASNRLISQVGNGLRVWEEMLNNGICKNRTANSLYKHFYKSILPRIRTFNLTENQVKRFEKLSKKNFE